MAGRRTATGSVLLMGLLLVTLLSIPAVQGQDDPVIAAEEKGVCLSWDISGQWDYDTTTGGYGRFELQQDADGNLKGSFWNEAAGWGGNVPSGKVNGTSLYFATEAGEQFEGTIHPDGRIINGTFTWPQGNMNGSWTFWGTAKCLKWQQPPAEGSAFMTVWWGEYTFYTEIAPLTAVQVEKARPNQIETFRIDTPNGAYIRIRQRFQQTGLPDSINAYTQVDSDPTQRVVGTLRKVRESGGETVYEGTIYIPRPRDPRKVTTNRVSTDDPRDPTRRNPVTTVRQQGIDPAGNIYNAATDEKIPDATCYLFKKEEGEWVPWPAGEFSQENPLVSDADGHYAWITDPGKFKVKATKIGFKDGWGGPVTVPPEVTDLHIGLEPTTSPGPEVGDLRPTNSRGVQRTEFVGGQEIEAHVVVTNPTTADMEVEVRWTTTGPDGKLVKKMTGSDTYLIGPFAVDLKIKEQIPSKADEGWYTMRIEVEAVDQTRFAGTKFWVTKGYSVLLPMVARNHEAGVLPPPPPPDDWITLVQENFEGSFPGPWRVFDNVSGYGEYFWARRTCRPFAGSYSGWAVGGGADGSSLPCGANYPDNAHSWMIYGPFSLADAKAAELRLRFWTYSQTDSDKLRWMASVDGKTFYGWSASGDSGGWREGVFDLGSVPSLGDLRGRSQVWVALIFISDGSQNYAEGVYVDDIILRKQVSTTAQSVMVGPGTIRGPAGQGETHLVPCEAILQR